MKKNRKGLFIFISIFLLILFAGSVFNSLQPKQEKIAYSSVIAHFESGQVKDYTLNFGSGALSVELRDASKFTYIVPDVNLFEKQVEPIVTGYNAVNTYKIERNV